MSYDYIRNYYGVDVPIGRHIQHTVTGRFGVVRPESGSNSHYVQVQFEGDRHVSNCHPNELDYDVADMLTGAA
ncbi:hypothetical protein [Agrobacterium vitis]|uniref:hypothetical protein n=1 Tax=Agrobacterium vitis TaxID=373 RepID=UPI0012E88A66|nr:hypothetical protein [Agrobacterium vitis]MVA40656.1 hypothetical protein [Agrobacterium vitis]NSX96933.1 hypothetical protein [Agrobacterium vitis]NSZ28072.1 hypothetical protein [Agrobacterium vitis]UJL77986.1 hypothetical protein AVCG678_11095 [Agrobacterium vitis]UJL83196.1 hypothetical protein AVCG78_11095 [Agrobacterium vitis]